MLQLQLFKNIWLNKVAAVLFLLFLVCLTAYSQYADTMTYSAKAQLAGVFNKTNTTKSFLANNNLRFSMMKKHTAVNWYGSWIYGKQNAGLTNNDVSLNSDYNIYDKNQRIYAWGFAAYDKSYSLKIINRFQGGFGFGYELLNSTVLSLNLSDGIIYENSNLDQSADPTVKDIETFRNSLRLKYALIVTKIIELRGSNYWQQSVENKGDYVIKANNTLNVKLKKWLSITVVMTYNRINITQRENFLLTYGLTFDKSF